MYSQPNFYSLETTLNFNFFFSIWTEYSCADWIFPKRAKSYIELTVITFYFHMGMNDTVRLLLYKNDSKK